MLKWTHTILNIIFFVPVIVFAFYRYKKIISRNKKFLISAALIGATLFFIVEPFATGWGAWSFDYNQTLGIKIGSSLIEEVIWGILVSTIVALAVLVGAEKEEKGEAFKIKDLFNKKNR